MGFIAGLWVGGILGFFIAACMKAAGNADRKSESLTWKHSTDGIIGKVSEVETSNSGLTFTFKGDNT